MHGEIADWTVTVQMLAVIADRLAQANWQRSGGKGARPRPIPRPDQKRRIGTASMSMDEMDAILGYSPRG
jgi:hypothetical protein